jgi:hypothetical protein
MIGDSLPVDTAVLLPVVRRAHVRPRLEISHWTTEQIQGGGGSSLGVHRIGGEGFDDGDTLRWSVILKVLGSSETTSEPASWGYWRREADVYQSDLLRGLPEGLTAPCCLGATEMPDGTVWLWLEDLGEEPITPLGLDDYHELAQQLGLFNGQYLCGEPIPDDQWLSKHWLRGWVEENADAMALFAESLNDRWVQRAFPRRLADELLGLWADRERYICIVEQLPQVVCHLDVFGRNIRRHDPSVDTRQTVLMDWAYVGVAAIGEELVPLVVANLLFAEVEQSAGRELEDRAIDGYTAGLRASGWTGDPDLVRLGYCAAAALRFGVGTMRLLLPILLDEGLHPIFEQLFKRPIHEVVDALGPLTADFTIGLAEEARELADRLEIN